jgi:hypothetical protein
MADLCGSRCVCDTIRAAYNQVDHNAGLHAKLSASWAFDMEAAPFYILVVYSAIYKFVSDGLQENGTIDGRNRSNGVY